MVAGGINSRGQDLPTDKSAAQLLAKSSLAQTNRNNAILADPQEEARAAALLRDYRGDLVFVNGKLAVASGFIAQYKSRKFFITSAHVLAGNGLLSLEMLDRTPIQVQSAATLAAMGHDLIAVPATAAGKGIPTEENVDTDIEVGDPVVVFGNSQGAGVVNPLVGKVVGIGPRTVEVSAQFEPGNSGGPIIQLRSGKVIGVATYYSSIEKLSGEQATRRFGYRLDTVAAWQHIDLKRFQYESDVLNAVHDMTAQLADALEDVDQEASEGASRTVGVDGYHISVPHTLQRHEYGSPWIRSAVETYLNAVHGQAGNSEQAAATLFDSLSLASQNNLTAAMPILTYDFFQHGDTDSLENEKQMREEIFHQLDKRLQARTYRSVL